MAGDFDDAVDSKYSPGGDAELADTYIVLQQARA